MSKISLKLGWKIAAALVVCAGIGATATLADKRPMPQNQREFEAFVAASPAQGGVAGHAFANETAKLFWFTDLEAAKKQAKLENKPILSLRLLGKLSDEYSCANSRFFRVIFYPQAQINPLLREKFVLHWSSERAVPVVTIDMGDGRVVKRTLTGNSAHYLLDENGRPLDVMPGVVTPARFAKWLENSATLGREWNQTEAAQRETFLSDYHRARMGEIWREVEPNRGKDEKWVATQIKQSLQLNPIEVMAPKRIAAEIAAPNYFSKVIVEAPILDSTRLFGSGAPIELADLNGARENFFAFSTPQPAILDDATKARIKATNPPLASLENNGVGGNRMMGAQVQSVSNSKATPKAVPPFDALIARFEGSIRADDRMAATRFLIPIHASFVAGKANEFESFNRKIYDRLFLTPKSDAWLGLSPDGTFTALQNGGLFEAKTPPSE